MLYIARSLVDKKVVDFYGGTMVELVEWLNSLTDNTEVITTLYIQERLQKPFKIGKLILVVVPTDIIYINTVNHKLIGTKQILSDYYHHKIDTSIEEYFRKRNGTLGDLQVLKSLFPPWITYIEK